MLGLFLLCSFLFFFTPLRSVGWLNDGLFARESLWFSLTFLTLNLFQGWDGCLLFLGFYLFLTFFLDDVGGAVSTVGNFIDNFSIFVLPLGQLVFEFVSGFGDLAFHNFHHLSVDIETLLIDLVIVQNFFFFLFFFMQ